MHPQDFDSGQDFEMGCGENFDQRLGNAYSKGWSF